MNERLKALKARYGNLVKEADDLRAQYVGDATMSAEDEERVMQLYDQADKVLRDMETEEKALRHAANATEPATTVVHPGGGDDTSEKQKKEAEYKKAFQNLIRFGEKGASYSDLMTIKAYQADSDTEGGFLTAPTEFLTELLKTVDNEVVIRQFARTFQLPKADNLGVPTLETDLNDADWTSELGTGSEDTAMRFGRRDLFPHPLAKRIKLSRRLIRSSVIDPENLVRDRMAYKFGVTQEKAFLTGTGVQQPLGVFTASPNGISTARDLPTGNATDLTPDGIIDATFFLKPQYWSKARWILHRYALRNIRKFKDADGNYIWTSGLMNNVGPRIMDFPYTLSEYAPSTFTASNYAAILGDFSFYWIAEALDLQVQVLTELYAETNQIGYIGRMEIDGMPVQEEAFVRLYFGT
jgi:HK97 family phage major capsid protein